MNPQELVQIDFTLEVNNWKLNASANVPPVPTSIVEIMPALQTLTSNTINATTDFVKSQGFEISCRAHCGACCRQLVPISLFEAEALADWIRRLPSDQRAVIEARFNQALAKLNEASVLEKMEFGKMPPAGTPAMQDFALNHYFAAKVPCPFLEDESCGIHPIRPLVCREYLVTSPSEFCAAPNPETVRTVPLPVRFSRALVRLATPLTTEKQGWLPLVFLVAWMKTGSSIDKAYNMPGPELLKLIVEQITTDDESPKESGSPQMG